MSSRAAVDESLQNYLEKLAEDGRTRGRDGAREAIAAKSYLSVHLRRARGATLRDYLLALHAAIEEARVDYRRHEEDPENWGYSCFNSAQCIVCDYAEAVGLNLRYRPLALDENDDLSVPNDVRLPRRRTEVPMRPWVRWERPERTEWIALGQNDTGLEVSEEWDQWWLDRRVITEHTARLFWAESVFGFALYPTDLPLYRAGAVTVGEQRFSVSFFEDARQPDLEAMIDARPADAGPAGVWIDWLLTQEDPFGEALSAPVTGPSLVGVLAPLLQYGAVTVHRRHGLIRELVIDSARLSGTRWSVEEVLWVASGLRAFEWLERLKVHLTGSTDLQQTLERALEHRSPFPRLKSVDGLRSFKGR